MALTPADVARLGELARIRLTDSELEELAPQLDRILHAVAEISEVATDDVPPTSHAIEMVNVFRPDEVVASFTTEQALSGAPDTEDGRFRVPRILGEEA